MIAGAILIVAIAVFALWLRIKKVERHQKQQRGY